jgi:hypothetical protein
MMMRFLCIFLRLGFIRYKEEGIMTLFSQLLSVYHAYDSGLISSELLDVINSVVYTYF